MVRSTKLRTFTRFDASFPYRTAGEHRSAKAPQPQLLLEYDALPVVPSPLLCHFVASLLHYASISGWERTVDLLLDHGADPRQTCMTGETALHFAVSLRHGEAAETLLKRSRDLVNEADKV